nr:uncharacterized protein LOC111510186 [Leptinotarsa decemlineata]
MFHTSINLILVTLIYSTNMHSVMRNLDREIRPRDHDEYMKCPHHICQEVNVYPEIEIKKALADKASLRGVFGIVLNSTYDITAVDFPSRTGLVEYGEAKHLCLAERSTSYLPRVMMNINLEWKFVVNVEGYEQIFTSEICRAPRKVGRKLPKSDYCSEFGFQCDQSYQEIYLLTFEDDIIDFDKFSVPTTCNCFCDKHVRKMTYSHSE